MSRAGHTPRPPNVVVLAGGGVAHTSGGVGTLMLYLAEEWARSDALPSLRIIDTRGQGGALGGMACFVKACAQVLWLGATGRGEVFHAHMTTRGSAVRKTILCSLATLLRRPTIVHMHGADFMTFYARSSRLNRWLMRLALLQARHVVVLGDAWRRFLIDTVGLPGAKVVILMNGVRSPGPVPPRTEAGPVRLLLLGRLGDRKGLPELVQALAAPALAGRSWVATLAGDGEVERFRQAVAVAGLAERVSVPGWVGPAERARLLAEASILVLPSHHEALPIAILEAMAYQVTVVATPVGAIPEILEDGINARLVPAGAADRLAEVLAELIDDPAQRTRLAAAAHATFRDMLDIEVIADRMLGLYRSAWDGPDDQRRRTRTPGRKPAMSGRIYEVLEHISPMDCHADAVARLAAMTAAERPVVVSFINQHALNLAWSQPHFAGLLMSADLLLRDGLGMNVCLRAVGKRPGVNMNGTDFIPVLGRAYSGRRVALYGTSQPWLDRAMLALCALDCDLIEVIDGYQPDETYVAAARACRPDLLILAMGMPKQERIAAGIAAAVPAPILIVNGGAIADFLALRFPRAPLWVRRGRVEWLFRFAHEPRRLWRRYSIGGLVFAPRVIRLRRLARTRRHATAYGAAQAAPRKVPQGVTLRSGALGDGLLKSEARTDSGIERAEQVL